MKEVRGTALAPLLRSLERLSPVPLLLAMVYPMAWVRALVHRLWKGPRGLAHRPGWLPESTSFRPQYLDRLPVYLNRIFEYLPDRLALPKWQRRCRIVGREHLSTGPAGARGAILAFVHFGPYGLLRSWLRSAGVPLSMLVGGTSEGRSGLTRRKDRWALFPEIQPAYYQDELSAAVAHLKAGRPLAMAIDVTTGRQMQIITREGWTLHLATGAVRLARRQGLPLVAAAIYNEGPWRFVIEISPPVSAQTWELGDEAVGADLIDKLLPVLRRHPHQCEPGLVDRFHKSDRSVPQVQAA